MLSDIDITKAITDGDIIIQGTPFGAINALQPASIDLHLGSSIRYLVPKFLRIDPKKEIETKEVTFGDEGYWLAPNTPYLVNTLEFIAISNRLAARVEGKSSLARLGLQVHLTAGFIDPGFGGQITLELLSSYPFKLYPNMPICQINFAELKTPAGSIYGSHWLGSKYQNQKGPVASKYHLNFKEADD